MDTATLPAAIEADGKDEAVAVAGNVNGSMAANADDVAADEAAVEVDGGETVLVTGGFGTFSTCDEVEEAAAAVSMELVDAAVFISRRYMSARRRATVLATSQLTGGSDGCGFMVNAVYSVESMAEREREAEDSLRLVVGTSFWPTIRLPTSADCPDDED